ncbi:DUF2550 domain-containing protein [Microlunatus flavus]|uniref:DUF2550 domain-containing protein n=1 Tax=Microlunatus flavus TaxID=1036181 RepID=A0A1H9F019_9ACTN|nr:DUF2550 domain-containing protein [Microlunatus flavus]SEQ31306.1 Protein of unknown function [Microlunatus flavus]
MSGFLGVLEVLGLLLVLAVLLLLLLAVRRRWLARRGGTFECSLRLRTSTPGAGWVLGVGRYNGGRLEWFRFFSFAVRPRETFPRGEVRVLESRSPDPVEAVALTADSRVLALEKGPQTRELAMSEDSLLGLLAWLEAAPPGITSGSRAS